MGETRKRILRTVLGEIVCTLSEDRIELLLHWRGGDHTRLTVARNRTGQHRWSSDAEMRDLIRALARRQGPGDRGQATGARQQDDGAIAATLNRLGLNRLGLNRLGLNRLGLNRLGLNRLGLNRLDKRTGRGNPWTEVLVRSFRSHPGTPDRRDGGAWRAGAGCGRPPPRRQQDATRKPRRCG